MKNNSSNSLHYDKSSQILLEAIEKVQQSIKETDAENVSYRFFPLVFESSNHPLFCSVSETFKLKKN